MKPLVITILVLMLAAVSVGQETRPDLHAPLDRILRKNVREELVDYLNIRKKHMAELNGYLDRLAAVKPQELKQQDRLAFYINLYNATMIKAVIERYHEGYSPSEDDFVVFKKKLVRLAGKTVSLNDLEHEIIRKQFKEPRIHVALVCAARSCPPLIARAYRGEDLEKLLQQGMRRFVNNRFRNVIDVKSRKLKLSAIFDWYAVDFGGKEKLADYVNKYHDADVSSFAVSFIEYSWELNIVKPKKT